MGRNASAVPHALAAIYMIVSWPAATPVIMPSALMVAMDGNCEVHVPTVLVSLTVIIEETHTLDGPDMGETAGGAITVTVICANAVPHEFVMLYPMVSEPEVIPLTNPPVTAALPLVANQVPPTVVSLSVRIFPVQTLVRP